MISAMSMYDPIVWLRIVRVVLFATAAILMWREPMACGGRNRPFHRMLGFTFMLASWYSLELAQTRITVLALTGETDLGGLGLLAADIAFTMVSIVLCIKLGYDYFEWRETHKLDRTLRRCNHECEAKLVR